MGDGWVLGLGIVAAILTYLKLGEMLFHTFLVWRVPVDYVQRLSAAVFERTGSSENVLAEQPGLWLRAEWPVTGVLIRMRLPSALRSAALVGFRWPVLMAIQALAVMLSSDRTLVTLGSTVLLAGVWAQLLQRFVFRVRLGHLDGYVRGVSSGVMNASPDALRAPHEMDVVADFLYLIARLVAMTVAAYATVYSAIHRLLMPGSFGDLGGRLASDASLLYFSLATITTTGDSAMVPRSALLRLLVGSETVAGSVLIVLLVASFSLKAMPTRR